MNGKDDVIRIQHSTKDYGAGKGVFNVTLSSRNTAVLFCAEPVYQAVR